MCGVCGCGESHHKHEHEHEHEHEHSHDLASQTLQLQHDLLHENDRLAARNRGWLDGRGVFSINLVSSPGAGKTTLLERILSDLDRPASVIEGDQATSRDAERIRATGCAAHQVNTGVGCHLDANMVKHAIDHLDPQSGSLLFIENVGNLVCPAMFDLGEHKRVVLFSVTDGDDKPYKYPHMFRSADLVVLTKIDLLPHVPFDVDAAITAIHEIQPKADVLRLSATSGEGLPALHDWLATHA